MKFLIGLLLSIFFLSLCGCDKQDSKNLIVGISAEYPPFEYVVNNKFQGFDIDLMKKVAQKLNKKVEFRDMQFSTLFPAINSRNIDLAISAIAITDERKNNFDISDAYFHDGIAVLYKDTHVIENLESLSDKKLATQLGTTMEIYLKQKFPDNKLVLVNNNNQGVENLKSDLVDAMVVNISQAKSFIKNNKGLEYFVVDDKSTNLGYGILAKKDSSLLPAVNIALKELKNNGEIEKLEEEWFK